MKSLEARAQEGALLYDCAKGTNLAEFVKEPGDPTDILNIQAPQRVLAFHEACVRAGSELIQTNTFNANRFRMELHGATEQDVYDINVAGKNQLFAYGANCGNGIDNAGTIVRLLNPDNDAILVVMKMNAGMPRLVGEVDVYDATPDDMANNARTMHKLGVGIIGSCCGSSPKHLEAMANALAKTK